MIPLALKLKKERYREIAKTQDLIVEELYKIFDKAVIHGGTSIWRCYKGNRFSEDIDAYILKDKRKLENFFFNLEKKGFIIEKKKIKENSLFSNLKLNRTYVRFEAIFKTYKGSVLREYENADGNFITVYTLNAEELIKEKIDAYNSRLKIRDMYDIFFLLRYVKDKENIKQKLIKFVKLFKSPIDENDLKILIFDGIAPDSKRMLDYIKHYI